MTLKDLEEYRVKLLMDDTKMPLILQEIKGDSMELNDMNQKKNNERIESKQFYKLYRNKKFGYKFYMNSMLMRLI